MLTASRGCANAKIHMLEMDMNVLQVYVLVCVVPRNNRYRMRTPIFSQVKICLHKMADFEGHF